MLIQLQPAYASSNNSSSLSSLGTHTMKVTRARLAQIGFCWSQRLTYNHAAKLANTITQKKAGEGQRKDPVNAFVTIVSQFTVI